MQRYGLHSPNELISMMRKPAIFTSRVWTDGFAAGKTPRRLPAHFGPSIFSVFEVSPIELSGHHPV